MDRQIVWVVTHIVDYEDRIIDGVFASRELAVKYIHKNFPPGICKWKEDNDLEDYEVEE